MLSSSLLLIKHDTDISTHNDNGESILNVYGQDVVVVDIDIDNDYDDINDDVPHRYITGACRLEHVTK